MIIPVEPNNNSPLNPEAASLWDNPESRFRSIGFIVIIWGDGGYYSLQNTTHEALSSDQ